MNRMVDAAVIENGPEAIVRDGLAYDRCQVGIVTGVAGAASLADYHLHDDEQLYTVLRTQVDVVLPEGVAVLNADDLLAAQMAPLCDGDVIFYARDGQREVIETHLAAGRRAVFQRSHRVLMVQGAKETTLIEWRCLPVLEGHTPEAVLGAVMAASAAAWGLGMEIDLIRAGIKTFATQSAPPAPAPLPVLAHTTTAAETPALASAA
jgi:cyanophycin synthetase